MKKFQKFTGRTARRTKPPRRVAPLRVSWKIREADGSFVADSGTGVRVWADEREKLARWLQGEK